jgi:transcriptional regulator with XRE-family HTH domain
MNESEKKQKQIKLLQQNLRSIRQIAGWTAEQLGDKIGVTKQTIGDLENIKRTMNLTQYLALRSILDDEIKSNSENSAVLRQVIEICVDKGAELEEENNCEIKDTMETVAASALKGKKGVALDNLLIVLLKSLSSPAVIGSLASLGVMLFQSGTSGVKRLE